MPCLTLPSCFLTNVWKKKLSPIWVKIFAWKYFKLNCPNILALSVCHSTNASLFLGCLSCRAVNNELLDTYQLKSLDGLVEGGLEDIAVVRRRRMKRRAEQKTTGKSSEKKGQLYLTLLELLDSRNVTQGTNVTAENLPGYHDDNFSLRQPYDRVIRCLGFRFNFTIFNVYEYFTAVFTKAVLFWSKILRLISREASKPFVLFPD